ncbi:alpha/beta hydrolase [Sulfuricurvum sp.]|uniref:alpha/beta hydrolase n=1 Tax=Sulfuricurvum sp. TaxID=2025608 RepID=UPI002E3018FB|nr:alpha/beta hydrolase [Sulfuricurvum sp.]HEX5329962.1 alpha/beta hydrolase [Sulfuricurvum sp.]
MRLFFIMVLFSMLTLEAGIIRDMIQKRASTHQEVKQLTDISYGSDKKQRLDVYLPQAPQNAPIIVMVHGGAWKMGDKKSENVVQNKMNRWVSKGAIFVSLNYRLVPKVTPMQQAEDVATGLSYVQAHAHEWGGDPKKILLMGHSAGAHLVSLVSADPQKYTPLGLKEWLGTVSLDTATMDLVQTMERKHYDFYDDVFGSDKNIWVENSPLYQLERSAPPMLLVCSSAREDKPCENSKTFVAKGINMGLRVEMSEQPLSHGEINDELGKPNGYTERVEQFIRSLGVGI